ncbi:MAG: hypothetical protein KAT16_01740 [Candidatus Heimdallarchaeota archaeon]|nr:hypothetical protein [Candidatus Heimdallarchaeota archaeon]
MNLLKQPKFNRWGKRKRGVSPVLATIIIFGLIMTGVMVTFIQVVPYIEQAQSEQTISSVKNSFIDLDNTIKSLISESGNPGGFRTVLFTKPAGTLDFKPDEFTISLSLYNQDNNSVYDFLQLQEIGILDWEYNSPRAVLPKGTSKYLTGPDPYKTREQSFLTGIFSTTDYKELTNLTLSHQMDRKHHITLNYRMAVYLTIETQPVPEIRFQIFLISLSTDFTSIHNQYKQISVHVSQNISTPYTLPLDSSVSRLDLMLNNIYISGTTSTLLWSTGSINGLSQVNYFNIVVQLLKYEVNLTT